MQSVDKSIGHKRVQRMVVRVGSFAQELKYRGQTATIREDIEVLFDDQPKPIDLELDLNSRMLY
jgi:hypothetical protein